MVKGFDGLEELICDGQDWQMLNVWIKFNRVCDNVMCIMAFYPPPDAYTSQQIANDNTYAVIPICIMCDCMVASVMSNEGNLLPEERHQNRCSKLKPDILAKDHAVYNQCEKEAQGNGMPDVEPICEKKKMVQIILFLVFNEHLSADTKSLGKWFEPREYQLIVLHDHLGEDSLQEDCCW